MDLSVGKSAAESAEVTNGSSNKRKDPPSPVQVDAEDLSVQKKKPAVDVQAEDKEQVAEGDTTEKVVVEGFEDLEGIEVVRVLSNSAEHKRIVIEGKSKKSEKTAIVILDKKAFAEDSLPALFSKDSTLSRTFQNDIYGSYDCVPAKKASGKTLSIVLVVTGV